MAPGLDLGEGDEDDEAGDGPHDSVHPEGLLLFNEHLPDVARSIRLSLIEHSGLDAQRLATCQPDGSIVERRSLGAQLRAAREEVIEALKATGSEVPATPGIDGVYSNFVDVLPFCPQAVLQGTATKLERMLTHLGETCKEYSLFRACQSNTPFMFDLLMYYIVLKYALVDAYASVTGIGNVTADYVFRGWPIEEQEERVWSLFGALWRVIWPKRDYCACVEAYDYYATMHARFDGSLHIRRGDFAARLLRPTSEARRMTDDAKHCDEWLGKDFQRIFSSYAKHSACLPGALMENIVCMSRWLLAGRVVAALNTAEMMTKVLSLSGTCLQDTHWPFTREDVQYNFARLALNWQEADVGCSAINRFGNPVTTDECPASFEASLLHRLLWSPSPLRSIRRSRLSLCSTEFMGACVVKGQLHVARDLQVAKQRIQLQTCSETGRKSHEVWAVPSEELAAYWNDPALEGELIGFVLNLPEFSNVWHNMHWLIPAVSRLHGDAHLSEQVPTKVVLLLLFDGYSFAESALENPSGVADEASDDELAKRLQTFVVRHAPLLRMLTSSPPQLFRRVRRSCFGKLIWGHPEMRADRRLASPAAVGPRDVDVFREQVDWRYWPVLQEISRRFWSDVSPLAGTTRGGKCTDFIGWECRSTEGGAAEAVRILLVQRRPGHGRSFLQFERLAALGLEPLAERGDVVWRAAEDLEKRTLLQQLALFSSSEVLVGAVGAALGWLIVMRPGAQVLEWLPREVPPSLYRCSEAWNEDPLGMFGGLGRLARVDHICLRSGSHVSGAVAAGAAESIKRNWAGTKTTVKDAYWRTQDLEVDASKFARFLREAAARALHSREAEREGKDNGG